MSGLHTSLLSPAHIRLVRQTEVTECGLACLAMVAQHHGLDVDLAVLRREYGISLRGAPLKSLMTIADSLGFVVRPVKLTLEALPGLHAPAILHWDMNHYVVLERAGKESALVHDPAGLSRWLPTAEVSKHFTGVALELRPSANFEKGERRERLRLSQLWRRVTGLKRALLQVFVLTLVLQTFVLSSPYYIQLAIDSALPALDLDLLAVLALGFGLFTLVNSSASLLRSQVLLSAGTAFGYGLATNVARRLFRLPVDWFERRHVGDVLSRFQSVRPIQDAMTQGVVAAFVDGVLALLVLAVMFLYSPLLSFVALAAFLCYAVARLISFTLQRDAQEAVISASAKEQSTIIESVRGIVTLRLFGREAERHALWQNRLSDSVNASLGLARIGIWQGLANTLLFGLENVITIWLAIRLAIGGGFSVGMVFAYLSYKTQFTGKAASFIDQLVAFKMLGLHLGRLGDIALTEEDATSRPNTAARTELKGAIELRGVTYRYGAADPVVLDRVDLRICSGEHVAITGPSGGGKSTLVKLLLGLVEPQGGDVLVDGLPLQRFGHRSYRSQIAAVLQEDSLFAGSIGDNIALFDDAPDSKRVEMAARLAALHEDIVRMPMAYESLVGDMGSALSGGQKARVLLARALYREPKLLILDEGTAHLDPVTEAAVNASISSLGITRIVIAHRAETVRHADRVFVLVGGKLREIGSPQATA